MIMTLPGLCGASALGVSVLGVSALGISALGVSALAASGFAASDLGASGSAAALCSGTRPGEAIAGVSLAVGCTESCAVAATGALGTSDERGRAGPTLREPGSPLLCSACCSLTFNISRKG